MQYFGGIEAGGTKFVCGIGDEAGMILEKVRIDTTTPEETLPKAAEFFKKAPYPIAGLGIGAFGPLDLDPVSPTFGYITSTPKAGWRGTDLTGYFQRALDMPVQLDTDVNAAALGEHRWGAAQGLHTFIYITIGTGIGGGALVGGRLLHGALHPEMGHIMLPHDPAMDPFMGACPFHGTCFEGLAAGPALEARWGRRGETLPPDHAAWALEAHYIALGVSALVYTLAPQRVILGGGVLAGGGLFPLVRQKFAAVINGYLQFPAIADVETYIIPPGLGGESGLKGALALAGISRGTRPPGV